MNFGLLKRKDTDEIQKKLALTSISTILKDYYQNIIKENFVNFGNRGVICKIDHKYFFKFEEDLKEYLADINYLVLIQSIYCEDDDLLKILIQRMKDRLPRELRKLKRTNKHIGGDYIINAGFERDRENEFIFDKAESLEGLLEQSLGFLSELNKDVEDLKYQHFMIMISSENDVNPKYVGPIIEPIFSVRKGDQKTGLSLIGSYNPLLLPASASWFILEPQNGLNDLKNRIWDNLTDKEKDYFENKEVFDYVIEKSIGSTKLLNEYWTKAWNNLNYKGKLSKDSFSSEILSKQI